ncbi:hypothetical protein ABW21_db0201164 [Orbilia brochopaga]|nr:hypothetical protein ABW21_db0201164 [Drechslerella brochopaga]
MDVGTAGQAQRRIGINDYLEAWGILDAQHTVEEKIQARDDREHGPSRSGSSASERKRNLHARKVPQNLKRAIRHVDFNGNPFPDMIYYSNPQGTSQEDWEGYCTYYYDDSGGRGINIYVLDSGLANGFHARNTEVFEGAFDRLQIVGDQYYFAHGPWEAETPDDHSHPKTRRDQSDGSEDGSDDSGDRPQNDEDRMADFYHGTKAISKIIGCLVIQSAKCSRCR